MAPANIVGKTCEKYLPPQQQRLAALRSCKGPVPGHHYVVASYGVSTLRHLFTLFEMVSHLFQLRILPARLTPR